MKIDFCIESQEIGDIILISNKAVSSNVQRGLQVIGSGLKKSDFSHAILALEKGIYIEAMKDKKKKNNISIFCIDELRKRFKNEYKDNWKIIRYKTINNDIQKKIIQSASYFYGQEYNGNPFYKIINKKHDMNASFCSELIQRIYEKSGIEIEKSNKDVWPVHLDLLTHKSRNKWEDITIKYNKKCSSFFRESFYIKLCKEDKLFEKYIFNIYEEVNKTINFTNDAKSYIATVINNLDKIEQYDKKSYNALIQEYAQKPTFYNTYIMPIISKYEIIDYNKNNNFNIEKKSYILEDTTTKAFEVNYEKYNELLLVTIQSCEQIMNLVQIYFDNLIDDKNDAEFTLQLKNIIHTYPLYDEVDILKSIDCINKIKQEYNNKEITTFHNVLIILIKSFRKIKFLKDNNVISTKINHMHDIQDNYQKYISIK